MNNLNTKSLLSIIAIVSIISTSCKKEKPNVIGQSINNKRLTQITDLETYFTIDAFEYDEYGYLIKFTSIHPEPRSKYLPEKRLTVTYERDKNHKVITEHFEDFYRGNQSKKTGTYRYNNKNELIRVDYSYENIYTGNEYILYVRQNDKLNYIITGYSSDLRADTPAIFSYDGNGNVTNLSLQPEFSLLDGGHHLYYFTYDDKQSYTPTIKGLDNFFPIFQFSPKENAQMMSNNNVMSIQSSGSAKSFTLEYNKLGLLISQSSGKDTKVFSYANFVDKLGVQ